MLFLIRDVFALPGVQLRGCQPPGTASQGAIYIFWPQKLEGHDRNTAKGTALRVEGKESVRMKEWKERKELKEKRRALIHVEIIV
jgi:hypothetical protein